MKKKKNENLIYRIKTFSRIYLHTYNLDLYRKKIYAELCFHNRTSANLIYIFNLSFTKSIENKIELKIFLKLIQKSGKHTIFFNSLLLFFCSYRFFH